MDLINGLHLTLQVVVLMNMTYLYYGEIILSVMKLLQLIILKVGQCMIMMVEILGQLVM